MKKYSRIFFVFIRAVLCYVSFAMISAYVIWCFRSMFWDKLDDRIINAACSVVFLFTMPSVVYAFALNDTYARNKFLEKNVTKFSFNKELVKTAVSFDFICEALVFFLFILLSPALPADLGYTNIPLALTAEKVVSEKLLICAVMIPLTVLSEIFMRATVRKDWFLQKLTSQSFRGAARSAVMLCVRLAAIAVIYAIGFMVFPLYLGNAPAAFMILKAILPFIVIAFCIFIFISYSRAVLERKKFIKELKALCREKDFLLSEIPKPYSFIFRKSKGADFTVTAHGKTYDCKFISGIHRSAPIMFDIFGSGVWIHYLRIRGKEILKYVHRFSYSFESDNAKILIMSPHPVEMFAGENNVRRRIDTGEKLGTYVLFNSKGFLRSLELDVMDGKGRFE